MIRTIFAHYRLNRFCADASGRLYAYEDELSAERARKKATRGTKVVAIKVPRGAMEKENS